VRVHRYTLALAGAYNILWGLYAALDPQWLFRVAGLPPQNHPQIFMTLGMVLGVYGLLYLEAARRPEDGFAIAAVGLLGKVLGPAGWVYLYATGEWPLATGVILVTNDLIWWVPFAWYLRDAWPHWRGTFTRA
jgi:hypothetical protein